MKLIKQFLTKRQFRIAIAILNRSEIFTINDIVEDTQIPKRSVYYDLSMIKSVFKEYKVEIINQNKSEFYLQASPEQIKTLKDQLNKENYILVSDSTERINYIIFELLSRSEPVLIKEIIHRFGISKPTVLKDFQTVKAELEKEHLVFLSRQNYGSYVSGKEVFIRNALNNFILDNYLDTAFALANRLNKNIRSSNKKESKIIDYFTKPLVWNCARALENYEYYAKVSFSELDRISIIFYFAIAVKRIQMGKIVEINQDVIEELKSTHHYTHMIKVLDNFEQYMNITIPNAERIYLMIQLLNGNMKERKETITETEKGSLCEDIVKSFIKEAATYLDPKIVQEETLYNNLLNHLYALIYRCSNGIPVRNQLLSTIQEKLPYSYFVAERCAGIIEQRIGSPISKEEIGYLAIYLEAATKQIGKDSNRFRAIIICIEGVATAWLLAASISNAFPYIEIIQVLSVSEYYKYEQMDDIDLIISTSQIIEKLNSNIPFLVINPILTNSDKDAIKRLIFEKRFHRTEALPTIQPDQKNLLSVLTEDMIQIKEFALDWKEVIDKASIPMLKEHKITEEYVRAMKYNIETYGSYVVSFPGVAILHANPKIRGTKLGLSLTTLEVPVFFGESDRSPISIAFVLSSPNHEAHMLILEDLVTLFQNEDVFLDINHAKNASEVIIILKDVLM